MKELGLHIVLDMWGPRIMRDDEKIMKIIQKAVKQSGSKEVGIVTHKFEPYGFSGVWLVAESHFSVHTFPEDDYISFDLYTCGNTNVAKSAVFLLNEFKPLRYKAAMMFRGIKKGKGYIYKEVDLCELKLVSFEIEQHGGILNVDIGDPHERATGGD